MALGSESVLLLACELCGCVSNEDARGWIGLRAFDPDDHEPPGVAFFCPTCATNEFGYPARRRRVSDDKPGPGSPPRGR